MILKQIEDPAFDSYGKVITGFDFPGLIEVLKASTPIPKTGVIYEPGCAALEDLPVAKEIESNIFGGMPIQIGYCNGANRALNCLEYHRGSELNIMADDAILLLAPLQKIKNNHLDTGEIEAFFAPAGSAVLLHETTLHYAPCSNNDNTSFRVAIVLLKDTNTKKPDITIKNDEDKLLWAKNKWLLAHPDSFEASQGAFAGLTGKNISL